LGWTGVGWGSPKVAVAKVSGGNHNSGVAAFIYPPDPIFKSIDEHDV